MKKIICVISCIVTLLSLSGCWSRKEPKTLAVVESALFDMNEDGTYQLTTEVLNPAAIGSAKGDGSSKNPSITNISNGKSLPEMLRNISLNIEKPNFGGHIKVRLFSEKFARHDMLSLMDYLLRDNLTDENPLIAVIKDEDPKKIYTSSFGLSETVGSYMYNMSKSQPKVLSKSVVIDTLQFIKDYYNPGKEPVAGLIELIELNSNEVTAQKSSSGGGQNDLEKKYKIQYEGLAAFKDNLLVGYFSGEEARAYNFITNKVKSAIISTQNGEDFTVFKVNSSKSKIKTNIENDKIAIDVKISVNTTIIQETEVMDITKMKSLKMIEETFNKQFEEEILSAIKKAQNEFQSDIFGFGTQFHIQHPQKWKEIKEKWNDEFSKATINVTVDSTISRTGELRKTLQKED